MKIFNVAIIILFILSLKVIAGEISGFPSITDGDTIKISHKRIRLYGIDAPEKKQICIKNFTEYSCGQEATNNLKKKSMES
jgi:endonuclease YncB( thermonuclease family)